MNTNRLSLFQNLWVEILAEIERSETKFGVQDGNPIDTPPTVNYAWDLPPAKDAKEINDTTMRARPGTIAHFEIILEEFLEVVEETDPAKVRKELVQLACVTIKAIRALDSK